MRRIRRLATMSVLTLVLARVAAAQVIYIKAGRIIDPATGLVALNRVIAVEGGRFTSDSGPAIPPRAQVIDLSRYTILPGLVDAHVHLAIGGTVRDNALKDLRAGFTTVVDLGARTTRLLRLRDSINAGAIPGPRVLAAGIWIGTKGGVCEFNGIGLTGADAFRERVRENVAAGADLIKVCVTGWPADAYAHPDAYEIADDALDAVIAESRAAGRRVIAHDLSAGGVRAGVRAGIDGLAHAAYVDSALAVSLRDQGVFMIPTLASLTGGDTSTASRALVGAVAVAHRVGVRLVFGTDGGVLPHGQNAQEFVALRDAGIPALDAIRAATVNAAASLGLADSLGRIAPRMLADLIAVEGDPLTDITALQRVRFVLSRGRPVAMVDTVPISPRIDRPSLP